MIERASVQNLRQSLEMAENLKKIGLAFVPIPYISQEQKEALIKQHLKMLDTIIEEAERPSENN
ncbi:DUF1382 family protein [Neisseria dumasiana]|uniref:DUF1382 domain-containing protein n=1 Tax=Neisseria dumasiana TaxID=1931275 RepID=A0A1X3DHZ3_9NEIS|nr:DUF1382 family protein [Neisseria dumasiana]OSI20426.1 hypothetical protein BV912_07600 [Neisseria dumasiana]